MYTSNRAYLVRNALNNSIKLLHTQELFDFMKLIPFPCNIHGMPFFSFVTFATLLITSSGSPLLDFTITV